MKQGQWEFNQIQFNALLFTQSKFTTFSLLDTKKYYLFLFQHIEDISDQVIKHI
jgi:hypothetical protein